MLLSHRTSIKISQEYSNIIGHMCYAASKLWNVCNYERHHYKELGLEKYPDWYYQKKAHKGNLWYKQLPSQTAQETCKQLDKAWKSFYILKKTGGIKDPNPPRFKQENIPVTYMQMGIRHEKGSDQLRLSLPKDLKSHMEETYGIHEKFLYLENKIFRDMDHIKQLRIYPPENGKCDLIVIYEIEEPEQLSQNAVCMVYAAIGKRNKISKIIETYPETLQEKAECSKGLPSQSDQMDCRILQKRRYPLCGCGRHAKYP